jgi:circadian clock protein KaiC
MNSTQSIEAEKASTGVNELDDVLGGGFPRGSVILLSGNPGAGKTILATQFLYDGALMHGEKGVYVSYGEKREDYLRNMLTLGMDIKALEQKGLFSFLDFMVMTEPGMRATIQTMLEKISKIGAKRVVVDSISVILQSLGQAETRKFLDLFFGTAVKSMGVTTLLLGEIPYGEVKTGFGVEEFVTDGVIYLNTLKSRISEKSVLQIRKMRGVALGRKSFDYIIDKRYGGLGLIVLPTRADIEVASRGRLPTGVEGLDMMLNGGVYRQSVTLIEGAPGIGKTTLCLQFLFANAQKGEKAMFISFEEPTGQVRRLLEDYGMDYKRLGTGFNIRSYVPEALTPVHYYTLLRDFLDLEKPTLVALDSVTAIQRTFSPEDFVEFMRYLQLLCKERSWTVFLTSSTGTMKATQESGISILCDNIFLMRYYELKDRMAREIMIIKTRGSVHEKRVVPFEMTGKGMVVHAYT